MSWRGKDLYQAESSLPCGHVIVVLFVAFVKKFFLLLSKFFVRFTSEIKALNIVFVYSICDQY